MSNFTAPCNGSSTPLHGSELARHILGETFKAQREINEAHAEALAIQQAVNEREIALHKEAIRKALDAERLLIGETHE